MRSRLEDQPSSEEASFEAGDQAACHVETDMAAAVVLARSEHSMASDVAVHSDFATT